MATQKPKRYSRSADILSKFNWQSFKQLMEYLEKIDEAVFKDYSLANKNKFIANIQNLFDSCEEQGNQLADLRETVGHGIELYFRDDYNHLMQSYKAERKKLRKLLSTLDVVLRKK